MHRMARFFLPGLAILAPVAAWVSYDAVPQEPAAEHQLDSPLETAMETIDRGMKALRRSVDSPEKAADNLTRLRDMQVAALTARGLCPEPFTPLSDVEKVVWRIGFERKMLAVTDRLLQVEQAIVEARFADAKALYSELTALKKEGHDTYVPPEEDEE